MLKRAARFYPDGPRPPSASRPSGRGRRRARQYAQSCRQPKGCTGWDRLHIGFVARSRAEVEAFHRAGFEAGYADNGAPEVREQYSSEAGGSTPRSCSTRTATTSKPSIAPTFPESLTRSRSRSAERAFSSREVVGYYRYSVVRRRILAWSGVRGMSPEFWRSRCSSLHLTLRIGGCGSR